MTAAEVGLVLAIFLACSVEAVEALTIVLAVGATRGWRHTLAGVVAALLTLAAVLAALGSAITSLPIDLLRILVGLLLLAVGLQWLRKAVLRASRRKPLHDERAIYDSTVRDAAREPRRHGDRYAFLTAYTAVLIEGLEVVLIVLSFSAGGHGLAVAVLAALLAVLLVAVAGVLLRAPLARVPENTLKLVVAVLLVSLGAFWTVEGLGLAVSEAFLPAIVLAVLAASLLTARGLRVARVAE
jgi:uncharacterized membrane protein